MEKKATIWSKMRRYRLNTALLTSMAFFSAVLLLVNSKNKMPYSESTPSQCNSYFSKCKAPEIYNDLHTALAARASAKKDILLMGMIEGPYLDFAINQHIGSVAELGLCNVLYFASDASTLDRLKELHMPTLYINKNFSNNEVGAFASEAFNEKSKVKLSLVGECLGLGYNVLISDVDVVFNEDPFEVVKRYGEDKDMVVQDNSNNQINTGFMYIRNTKNSIDFFNQAIKKMDSFSGHDQAVFNFVKNKKLVPEVSIEVLPLDEACVGHHQEPKSCAVFHANFKAKLPPKILTLKKHGLWKADEADIDRFLCR